MVGVFNGRLKVIVHAKHALLEDTADETELPLAVFGKA
jgi:hypothetical protein